MRVSGVTIAGNLVLSLLKLLAGILGHSGAMISDAVHSASDVFSTVVAVIGINISRKKNLTKIISMVMTEWNVWQQLFWQ